MSIQDLTALLQNHSKVWHFLDVSFTKVKEPPSGGVLRKRCSYFILWKAFFQNFNVALGKATARSNVLLP